MYYVYILKSIIKKDEMYIGSTIDLKKRIGEHNNGKEISTKRYKPWHLLYYEAYNEEKLARIREKKLKHHGNALRELKKRAGILKSGAGFTILELMITIVVISIGVLGAYSVVQQIFTQTFILSSRLTAAYLAQEGIEIVRNIRDTNWLKSDPWNNGLGAGDYEVDWNDAVLTLAACSPSCTFDGLKFLDFSSVSGRYYYDSSPSSFNDTKFKRKITITPDEVDKLKVFIEIMWTEKGKDYTVTVQENLYDWKTP